MTTSPTLITTNATEFIGAAPDAVFADPVAYLAAFGVEATVVADTTLPFAA